jgi:hypothetical protein
MTQIRDITLPNGQVITGVPDSFTKAEIKDKAIKNNLAVESDFPPDKPEEEGGFVDYLQRNAEVPGAIGGAITGAAMGAPFGPPGMVVGGIVGGAVGSFGGSLYSDDFEGEDLDYIKAMEEAAISVGMDVATLGLGKYILKPGWLASKRAMGLTPKQALDEVAKETAEFGTGQSVKQSQEILNKEGLSLTPHQAQVGSSWDIAKENIGRTGLLSKNVFRENEKKVVDVVRTRMRSLLQTGTTGTNIPTNNELGAALYDAFDQGRKSLTTSYGEGLDQIGTTLSKNVISFSPLTKGISRFQKENLDSIGNSTLNKKTIDVIEEMTGNLKDVTSGSAKYLLDFEKALNKKISDVSNFGSANFDLDTARELTNLSRRMKVISRREMKKVDPKAALSYRTLQRNYSEITNALYPEINTRFITQAGKGGFSSLGKMFSMAGASDNIGMAFRSIDTAYKQMSPKDIAKLPYKSAADAKKAVRTSYVQSVLPNAEKATFDLKDFTAVAKSLNDPTEAARVRTIMGDSFNSYRRTVNLMASAASKPESGLATLFLRSKEFTALGGVVAAAGAGIVKASNAAFSVATILGGPVVLAKIATSPKHVNKLIQLDKMGAKGASYADLAKAAAVIANDFLPADWEREQLNDAVDMLYFNEVD